MKPEQFLTHSLQNMPYGQVIAEIMATALNAVDPAHAVRQQLRCEGDSIRVATRSYHNIQRLVLVGAGKAGAPMLQAAVEQLGERINAGLVVVKEGHLGLGSGAAQQQEYEDAGKHAAFATLPHAAHSTQKIYLVEAGHPIPDERGVAAAQQIAALLQGLTEHDLVLVLLSGGGSALLTWPAPGLSLTDLQSLTTSLLRCGASIGEINTLRKHCTRLFGGQLAQLAAPAQLASLIVSDVVGSPLDVIASGPSTADPTSYADAWQLIERYDLAEQLAPALGAYLQRGLTGGLPETPKPDLALWERVHNTIIASNAVAAEAACIAARNWGFQAEILTSYLEGEARELGRVAASIARERVLRGDGKPALMIAGGETTVTLRGHGLGGRNQELALGAVEGLAGLDAACIVALASDGGDGPTDAAGAVVTGQSWQRARLLGLHPAAALRHNDAYHFFEELDDLLRPGPTLTNVNDLLFIFTGLGTSKP